MPWGSGFCILPAMLLIFPPIAKPSEPPAGIARLSAALGVHGVSCELLDANLEGLLYLLEQPTDASDTWSRRARKNLPQHLRALRNMETYRSPDRYARGVSDLNRLLAVSTEGTGAIAGLADYQHQHLSPLRSADLLAAAGQHEQNPFYPWFSCRLPEAVETKGDGTVGFSLNYLSQALTTFAMAGFLRKRYPDIKIILGGGLVTSWMSRPGWRNPFGGLIDHLICGPGELPLLQLNGISTSTVPHATPDYSRLPLDSYLSPGLILPYSAAGGCYWNRCTFCPESAEGNSYHPVPARQVLTDLGALAMRHRPVLLHLLDSAISPSLLQALPENPLSLPWYGFARIDHNLADLGFCLRLRKSGCVLLKLGLESGDQGVLNKLNKGIDIGTASLVLTNLKTAGIGVYLYLLFGTPAETEMEARQTLEFVIKHRDSINFLNLALFNMPIASSEAAAYGGEPFYEGDLSLYTAFRHPHGWDRNRVRRFLNQEFTRHPAVASIVRNDPPIFTSNHAPFFTAGALAQQHLL